MNGDEFNYLPYYWGSINFPAGLASEQLAGQDQAETAQRLSEMPKVLIQGLVGTPPEHLQFHAQRDKLAEMYRSHGMIKELLQNYDKRNRFINEGKTGITYNQSTDVFQDFMGKCLEVGRKNKLWDSNLNEVIYAALSETTRQEVHIMGLSLEGCISYCNPVCFHIDVTCVTTRIKSGPSRKFWTDKKAC